MFVKHMSGMRRGNLDIAILLQMSIFYSSTFKFRVIINE